MKGFFSVTAVVAATLPLSYASEDRLSKPLGAFVPQPAASRQPTAWRWGMDEVDANAFLQQLFNEYLSAKAKDATAFPSYSRLSTPPPSTQLPGRPESNPQEKPQDPETPEKPVQPVQPDDSGNPGIPEEPQKPDEPGSPETPDKPENPTTPEIPEKPVQPQEPVAPEKPGETGKPVEPEKPEETEKPEKPDETEKPEKPEKPDELETPNKPDQNPPCQKPSDSIPAPQLNHHHHHHHHYHHHIPHPYFPYAAASDGQPLKPVKAPMPLTYQHFLAPAW